MLSEANRQVIRKQYLEYKSYRKVAQLNNISPRTVRNIILNLYVKDKQTPGPKPKITPKQEAKIKRLINSTLNKKMKITARLVKNECGLEEVGLRTIQHKLKALINELQANKAENHFKKSAIKFAQCIII